MDKWIQTHKIEFEPLSSYSEEQNKLSKVKKRTFMEQVQSTIRGKDIPHNLWCKVLLAIKTISNLVSTSPSDDLR